ncbi:MAG: bifunctional rhamnulose-1-phosphate aldolase/short-chain dehydrogenase [Chloroflexota bacterium]
MTENRWDRTAAPAESEPVALAVYRSLLIGADETLVVWGGGNTSVKTVEIDHLGNERRVLRIKGSGTDLKSIDALGFPGIFLDDVLPLRQRTAMSDEEMVAYLEHCLTEPGGKRPSIETLLHAFLPARHIDHTHADAIIALTNADNGEAAVREALGEGVAYVPWQRPGFALSKAVGELAHAGAVVLGNHGLVTWGETAEESYSRHIDLVRRAERWLNDHSKAAALSDRADSIDVAHLLLRLRSRLGHRILRLWTEEPYQALARRRDIAQLAAAGSATADHVLRIRPWVCVLESDGEPANAIDAWEERYHSWFATYAPEGLAMLNPLPKVFIVPGLGLITAGRNERDAVVTAEVALHTLQVAAQGQDAHGLYRSLNDRDLFEVEYWPLELYKLTLAPPPRELESRVVVVTGAASGIGRAVARHLASLGALVFLLDQDAKGLDLTARQIREAGGDCRCLILDLTDDSAVQGAVGRAILEAGGIDALVANAGIAAAGNLTELDPTLWRRSLEVNATAHYVIAAAVMRAMATQALGGSLVFVASKNAFGPGAGFGAYSVAKAGQVQLARIAALEGGPLGIRANVVNPDAVFEDSRLWTDDVRRERAAAHGVSPDELESFYAQRTLLKRTVTGRDVAEAVAWLVSARSRATTGTVITVDGGVASAFPR